MSGTGNQITTLETNIEEFINIEKSLGNGILVISLDKIFKYQEKN